MENLFAYGTLLFPEIVLKITGKSFKGNPALLKDYERRQVKGCDYPAIINMHGSIVNGVLLENVDEKSIQLLAHFEGNEYEKRKVEVIVNNVKTTAVTFVWNENMVHLSKNDWDIKVFKQNSLKFYR
jgi:gamma-glutamylcyclotransferase (GGCT)/AIG2-like uncharacterized protein YtfP